MLLQIHGYLLLSRLQRVTIPVYKTFVRNGISSVQYVIPCQNSDETSSVSAFSWKNITSCQMSDIGILYAIYRFIALCRVLVTEAFSLQETGTWKSYVIWCWRKQQSDDEETDPGSNTGPNKPR